MSLDFLLVSKRMTKTGFDIYPTFKVVKSNDLMVRGNDFYAIWDEENGRWSEDEQDAIRLIDREIDIYADKLDLEGVHRLYLWNADTGMIDKWHKYVRSQCRDSFHTLNESLIFSNSPVRKRDYASIRLPYPLETGSTEGFDTLLGVLYSEEERAKLLWTIGAIVSGDSKRIQKFVVLYGPPKTGKSTAISIMEKLFEGYYTAFDAKTLGSASNAFALEAFRSNPLVAIQHDGDLSRIEDNTRINSLVSHEKMTVNEKFKSAYSYRFNTFLIMGTNKPVKITDGKSGIIRRLIDITPTGEKLPKKEYDRCMKQIEFELGSIASKCLEFYKENKDKYDDYVPVNMLEASNDFYNFVIDSYHVFKKEDGTTLTAAWAMYQQYVEEAKVLYPLPKRAFKEELKLYFKDFHERFNMDGNRVRSWYQGFRSEKFESDILPIEELPDDNTPDWLKFDKTTSLLDILLRDCPAQLAKNDKPSYKWENVKTKLSDISTGDTHYVKPPVSHIVVDLDIPDANGNKCLALNVEAAKKFPKTYAELSKSGQGIHLHYIYTGDVSKLSSVYAEHIEIKIFTGGSSLRRKLTRCNDVPVSDISSGLPLRKEQKVVDFEGIKNEKILRSLVAKNLRKEIVPNTKPSIDLIVKDLETAYNSGMKYDISDLRPAIAQFAAMSTNQSDYCMKQIAKMKFKSENRIDIVSDISPIVFFDVEIFPNLFLVCWKIQGDDASIVTMINPKPADIEDLLKFKLVGFNNRRYDNHMIYACLMGYSPAQLFDLSQNIINNGKGFFGEAYGISYTDIYDFAAKKQSLKKWEIELGIHHQELGLKWNEPVPEELWEKVAEYCKNDVRATEAVFNALHADYVAREVLADVAGMTVNDTTNSLTTRIIFGKNRNPQTVFNYRDMGNTNDISVRYDVTTGFDGEYTTFTKDMKPIFPGYKYDAGVSTYRGEEIGEGGYVYAEPGIYTNVALLDIASMHPSSIVAENLFGDEYTQRFKDILDARIAIKHKDFDKARTMLGGALAKYLDDESAAADLAQALKIAINSVYGLTSAKFDNPFRDIRNVDNIVAKRGALFMVNLKHEVQQRGFTVAHIKTDSIKIPNANKDIIDFVMHYGKLYGYNFEHEATYQKMCLVNDAVYIAKYQDADMCKAFYGYIPEKNAKKSLKWTATGTQFQVPYVFKTLFEKSDILFKDKCETKSASTAIYMDCNESLPEGEHNYIFVGKVGLFCPVVPGVGGGLLVREQGDKYNSVGGTKGYRWLESETVKSAGLEDKIDISYYTALVDDALKAINQYGDAEWFCSDEPVKFPPEDDDLPF